MNQKKTLLILSLLIFILAISCSEDTADTTDDDTDDPDIILTWRDTYPAISTAFGNSFDLDNLDNYANQAVPSYITKDNTGGNVITDKGAILGRVLFYDKNLSVDNTIACASCHQQEFAFSDTDQLSAGVDGETGRHSMRLVNTRFADEFRFFWDERASTLEEQTTMPIQDHIEMGFSGENGDPDFNDLITKLEGVDYYPELFTFVYGDENITETRMQECLAQFIRSIQSFDSKFDEGRAAVTNIGANFSNFSAQENLGKALFLNAPGAGGAGCAGCHRGEEFDINPVSGNNNVITSASGEKDFTITRAPSLRDIFNNTGILNGSLMHDGSLTTLESVIDHYNQITIDPENTDLDPRLSGGPGGTGQNLALSDNEKAAIVAFIKTLSGEGIYTDEKWSDPFD